MASPLRLLPSRRLPLLLLLALAAALLSLPSAESTQASAAQSVPSDWEHIPQGIAPGDSFRLLFVTSATRDASSSNIADYNAHVQGAAGGNDSLKSFKDEFTALISTSAVDARENTGTTGTGVPVHWLGGEKVADDYADLYDRSWDSVAGRTENGSSYTGLVWTGGNKMGEKSGLRYAGAAEVRLGDLGDATLPLSSPTVKASGEAYPLYALSPVITVAEPEPTPTPTPEPTPAPTPTPAPDNGPPTIASGPVIASSPASGDTYGKGETIEVSYTFSEAVIVTGAPRVRLFVGERKRWAHYSHAGNGGATLVFTYVVRPDDRDDDGVKVGRNGLKLSGGSIADADGNAARLRHAALPDQAEHRVDGADSPGRIILNTDQPQVGRAVTAGILDPDGDASGVAWTWARSADRTAWEAIAGATGASYTPSEADVGRYLRVSAAYSDPRGPGKTAGTTTANPVSWLQGEPQTLTGTIFSGVAKTNVADLSAGQFVTGSTFSACLGQNCTPPATGRVAWNVKITGVGITVRQNGEVDYDGTILKGSVLRIGYFSHGALQRTATITVTPGLTIWSATLTVDVQTAQATTYAGCDDEDAKQDNCSVNLRPNRFTFQGAEYTVRGFYTSSEFDRLALTLGSAVPRRLSTATLHVGARTYAFADDQNAALDTLWWDMPGLSWSDGDTVSAKLIVPPPPPLPAAPAAQTVPPNWPLLPAGVEAGQSFRLLFATSATTEASEPGIGHYDTHVQNAADGNASLKPFKGAFRALMSTEDLDARDNTATNTDTRSDPDAPIYWLGGAKVADDYADFYDGSWDSRAAKTEAGAGISGTYWFWFGSNADGTMHATQFAGESLVSALRNDLLISPTLSSSGLRILALSPLITVMHKAAGLTATPGSGSVALDWYYGKPKDDDLPDGTRWQYRLRTTSQYSWGHWIDVYSLAHYRWITKRRVFLTIEQGLNNGTEYEFQVRLVDQDGNAGPVSDKVTATPRAWGAPEAQTIPADSPLIPRWNGDALVGPGESFRVLFITSDERHAMSADIDHYNHFVTQVAAGNKNLKNSKGDHFGGEFRALISTATTDARDNTASTGEGVPIFYLGGGRLADDYGDFYDGSWQTPICGRNESGEHICYGMVWTGSLANGTRGQYAGQIGWPGVYVTYASVPGDSGTLNEGVYSIEAPLRLYALSPVLTVAEE